MTLKLVIGNKNYSSWSMRPWLALRANGIAFEEIFIPLYTGDGRQAADPEFHPFGQGAGADRRRRHDLGFAGHHRICSPSGFREARLWPEDRAARAHARSISAEMHSGFMALRNECGMNLHRPVGAVALSDDARANVARIQRNLERVPRALWQIRAVPVRRLRRADAMFAPVVHRFRTYAIDVSRSGRPIWTR